MRRLGRRRPALAALFLAAVAAAIWYAAGAPWPPSGEPGRPPKPERAERAAGRRGDFSGKVVAVLDGDTVDVLRDGKAVRVRLAGIDCPEKKQPFGAAAKRRAAELAFGREVAVAVAQVDRYGRSVGTVALPEGGSLNERLVRDGLAWWYRQYSSDRRLEAAEAQARAARRGLWSEPSPIPPWEWRRARRDQSPR